MRGIVRCHCRTWSLFSLCLFSTNRRQWLVQGDYTWVEWICDVFVVILLVTYRREEDTSKYYPTSKFQLDWSYSQTKLPPSWCHWRTDDGSERSRKKKNTAPWWFEKQKKILGRGYEGLKRYLKTLERLEPFEPNSVHILLTGTTRKG